MSLCAQSSAVVPNDPVIRRVLEREPLALHPICLSMACSYYWCCTTCRNGVPDCPAETPGISHRVSHTLSRFIKTALSTPLELSYAWSSALRIERFHWISLPWPLNSIPLVQPANQDHRFFIGVWTACIMSIYSMCSLNLIILIAHWFFDIYHFLKPSFDHWPPSVYNAGADISEATIHQKLHILMENTAYWVNCWAILTTEWMSYSEHNQPPLVTLS